MRALHPLPEGRYEGALEMGDALRDGLRGIAPDPTDATVALDPTSATGVLGDTGATRVQTGTSAAPRSAPAARWLPLDDGPRRREPARRATAAPPVAPRRAARKRRDPMKGRTPCSCCCWRSRWGACWRTRRSRTTPIGPNCARTSAAASQDAVDEIKGLIEDNTQIRGQTPSSHGAAPPRAAATALPSRPSAMASRRAAMSICR